MPVPTMLLTQPKQDSLLAFIDTKIKAAENALKQTVQTEQKAFDQWQSQTKEVSFDPRNGLQAHFTFDRLVDGRFVNERSNKDSGKVLDPVLVPGRLGNAFQSNGDDILTLGQVGVFNRSQPFSIGVWVNIPKAVSKAALVHKGNGDILYNFRGYFLNLRDDKAELLMAHTWPYNSLVRVSQHALPKEKWIHLTMTYDGSSKASGLRFYLNGQEAALLTEKDNLYKDILFTGKQTGLMVGADMRGPGFKKGLVDELVVYNRALTPPEVQALAQSVRQVIPMKGDPMKQYFSAIGQRPTSGSRPRCRHYGPSAINWLKESRKSW